MAQMSVRNWRKATEYTEQRLVAGRIGFYRQVKELIGERLAVYPEINGSVKAGFVTRVSELDRAGKGLTATDGHECTRIKTK
jgi:hypothetical protein